MGSEERHKEDFWNDLKKKEDHYKPEETKTRCQDNTSKKENDYHRIARDTAKLVMEKQKAYGDSFGNSGAILKILYPSGITTDQYGDVLTIIRIVDKLFRIANRKDAFGESPYRDILGYALLAIKRDDNGH